MTLKERFLYSDFHRVFNCKTPENTGRTMLLLNSVFGNVANAVISGALYTSFLAENGIDIVRVGVISFIPYLSWLLSIFSPMVMSKFKKRRGIFVFNSIFYYCTVVLATTIMPRLVEDPAVKTVWFAVFLFLGNAVNAVLGSGTAAWHLHFIPEGRDLNVYVHYTNLAGLVLGNATGIISSVIAESLAKSGNQLMLLFWMRIGSFVLFLVAEYLLYVIPKEYPYPESNQKVRLSQLFTSPLRHRPFMLTLLIPVFWNIVTGLNANTYNYYLLETVHVPLSYLYINAMTSMLGSILLSGLFRRLVDRASAYLSLCYFLIVYCLMEMFYVFLAPGRIPMYAILVAIGGATGVGFSMAFNGLFYLQLPEDANKDLFFTFWNLVANLAAFAGASLGTWILALFESHGVYNIFGMPFYGSQLICAIKVFGFGLLGLYCYRISRTLKIH